MKLDLHSSTVAPGLHSLLAATLLNKIFFRKIFLKIHLSEEDFTNFFPKANLTYKFNENNHFSIIYNGNTKQPSIRQVQPVPSNLNPLNIIVGNPLLKPEFDHIVNFNFNSFNLSSEQGIFLYGSFSIKSQCNCYQ